jgi:hypothetical protein
VPEERLAISLREALFFFLKSDFERTGLAASRPLGHVSGRPCFSERAWEPLIQLLPQPLPLA